MNIKKKVTVTGTIFLLLAGATILSEILTVTSNRTATGLFFPEFDSTLVTKVALGDSANGVVLTKTATGWMVADRSGGKSYHADQLKMNALLDKLGLMQKDQLVSENKSNHKSLEVTPEKGVSVSFYTKNDKPEKQFYIGKKSENWQYTNVRVEGEKTVYLVSGSIQFAFVTTFSEWRDRAIFAHPMDSIKKIILADGSELEKIQGVGETFWLARNSGKEVRANQEIVNNYLESMSKFTCDDWADESTPDSLWMNPEASYSVTFGMEDNSSETITLGKKDPSGRNRYYFKNSSKSDLFFVVGSGAEVPFISYQYITMVPEKSPVTGSAVGAGVASQAVTPATSGSAPK